MTIDSQQKKVFFDHWQTNEALAESMIPLIGYLYRERNVVTSLYSRPLVNRSVISILKHHKFAKQIQGTEVSVSDTYPVLKYLSTLPLLPSRIDIGKLAVKYKRCIEKAAQEIALETFMQQELAAVISCEDVLCQPGQKKHYLSFAPKDIVLYGFGRIGRLLARILIEKTGGGDGLRLKAIVVRKKDQQDLFKRASLLRRDSVHGSFQGTINVDEGNNGIIANGNFIQVIYANDPADIDYSQYGIQDAILVDNTGKWRDEAGLSLHLESKGISRVVLTAPGKGDLKNIVFGVNQNLIHSDDRIISAASCTTNAIVPVLKVVNDLYGIEAGHVETVHSYTNDQNLIDNYHAGHRRGRSAPLNMVITETGAAKAAVKALPELAGKLTGNAIRVPTPNVSLAILSLTLVQSIEKNVINEALRQISLDSPLRKQIDYIDSPEVVSSDFIGSRRASIVDAQSTVANGRHCVLYIWYDNEFGYSCQVARLLQSLSGIEYPAFPKEMM